MPQKSTTISHGRELFLCELIVAIFLFFMAAALVVLGFTKTKTKDMDAVEETNAVAIVQNEAETIRSINAYEELPSALTPVYYDSSFNETSAENASYAMYISYSKSSSLLTTALSFRNAEEDVIYELTFDHYLPE